MMDESMCNWKKKKSKSKEKTLQLKNQWKKLSWRWPKMETWKPLKDFAILERKDKEQEQIARLYNAVEDQRNIDITDK